ncbi:DNA repair protein (mre11) [Spizellomyces punctatus DAOM BR117]|uniref:Double-strand break repair protein n=1 Tax=Spizellomyces punctatus (strain DAOM BR117) TaxID=645134 RepID=A0A0L0HUM8_SPIPD|nr:DNA repair protein (mre11) [Spizellomyces punctatus DAOM BR117]KND04585.1 DNA repair protein (mre11) [Spizellomyces punctatus DAOM BR117]|eukprot:XP_016612624.1 DNA repair protein (mre11) [Spizellomyces punctatus DAOM BR117]
MTGGEGRKVRVRRARSTDADTEPDAAIGQLNGNADPNANTFKILIATDNHVGYMEKDPIRGNDSFEAFEEILQLAQENEVDFVLLGGDLFHDNKPSRKCLHTTMTLLRQYCLGERPCQMEFLSDQNENFPNRFATVNYQDPNFNIGMPVFSIHGNHDDPSGDGSLCALDLLSVAGLVNYFGKQVEVDDISIKPILLQKGTSKLALYGLGNVRDERLHRTFQKKKVKMYRPQEDTNEWFNLMAIHQNRIAHGPTNFIPETFLDEFLNLILWGHEHECLIEPVRNSVQDFWITQPGSSVATSLCEGEAVPKHVGLLSISGSEFKLDRIRLKKVRPFVMDEVILKEVEGLRPTDQNMVNEFLQDKVAELITIAMNEWKELNPDVPEVEWPKPLVRLKVEYGGGFTTFNPQRFGQVFVNRVANPKDILLFYRKRASTIATAKKKSELVNIEAFLPEKLENFRVEDLVTEYLNAQNLDILPENELADAVRMFVEKDDKDAIKDFVVESLKRTRVTLSARHPSAVDNDDAIKEEIEKEKKKRFEEFAAESDRRKATGGLISTSRNKASKRTSTTSNKGSNDEEDDVDRAVVIDSDDDDDAPATAASNNTKRTAKSKATTARGRGRGRGRGRVGSSSKSTRSPLTTAKVVDDQDDDGIEDIDDDIPASAKTSSTPVPTSTRKRKLPTSISTTSPAPLAKRTTTTSGKSRQSKLNFGASQQRAVVLDDDDDMTFSNFRDSIGAGARRDRR